MTREAVEEGPAEALREAAEVFRQSQDARLAGMFHQVRIAVHVLEQQGCGQQLDPLRRLLQGLDALNHGRKTDLFRARRDFTSLNEDKTTGRLLALQAISLVVVELFYRGLGARHGDRQKAEKLAAKFLSNAGWSSDRNQHITHDILRQWRSRDDPRVNSRVKRYLANAPQVLSMSEATDAADAFVSQLQA